MSHSHVSAPLPFHSYCVNRYADPAVHRAYIQLLASRPDLSKACNGVILYGLCKCDRGTGLAAVKRLSELPEAWTNAARVNASAFLYQKVGVVAWAAKRGREC